jgi:hypothetical protein
MSVYYVLCIVCWESGRPGLGALVSPFASASASENRVYSSQGCNKAIARSIKGPQEDPLPSLAGLTDAHSSCPIALGARHFPSCTALALSTCSPSGRLRSLSWPLQDRPWDPPPWDLFSDPIVIARAAHVHICSVAFDCRLTNVAFLAYTASDESIYIPCSHNT